MGLRWYRHGLGTARQRAAGGYTPPGGVAGLVCWFDFSDVTALYTDAGSTKVSLDGDAIYRAFDKSGGGFHGNQSTLNSRPLYKVNIQNSLACGYFDHSDDRIAHAYPLGAATDLTVFIVLKLLGIESYTTIYGRTGSSFWDAWAIHLDSSGRFYAGTDVTNRIGAGNSPTLSNDTFYSIRMKKEGTSSGNLTLSVNNAAPMVNTGKTAANPASNEMLIGDSTASAIDPLYGYVGEYLVYNTALAAGDITTIETYLNNKWSIY